MILTLERFAYLESATLGNLIVGDLKLATIERPWIQNPAGSGGTLSKSCIPDGAYRVRPHTSERFPDTFAIVNEALGVYYQSRPPAQAWGRTAILIHVGNFVTDVIGCVAVGLQHGGTSAVTNSRAAMDRLREVLKRDSHDLLIEPRGAKDL